MAEEPIEGIIEENGENVPEAIQTVSTIKDHMHDKTTDNIKWA